jgi:hypothetical protein
LASESKSGALNFSTRKELQDWLESLPPEQGRWVAVAIAARTALRVVPLVATDVPRGNDEDSKLRFQNLAFAVFFANAVAWAVAQYPTQRNELEAYRYAARADATTAGPASAAAIAAYAAADAAIDNMARADDYSYAVASATDAADAASDIWAAVSRDANFIASGETAHTLASQPLWPNGVPEWAEEYWKLLQEALPREDKWQVWIDWYNRRLVGLADPEEIELLFATVPYKERDKGRAAANRWIGERLEELQRKDSSPPETPRQGPGPHVEIDEETGAIVPAKPESLNVEGNNVARLNAQHPQIVRLAGELLANLGQNEQPELFAAAKNYFGGVNRDLSQIDFERLWGEGVYLEEAAVAAERDIKNRMREPLNDAALTALNALLRIHGPFILATRAGLQNLAFANAYDLRSEEEKEQRAAALELAQEFKANSDVVSPETAASFAHFAEQPESTPHPERSGAFRMGMARNIAIVITAGATIGAIIVEIGLETGNPVAGLAALPLIEGLKKSKPFLDVAGLVAGELDKLSEADARALLERLNKIPFDRYRRFVLDHEALLRRLAGAQKQSHWLHEHLDWLKRMNEPPQ